MKKLVLSLCLFSCGSEDLLSGTYTVRHTVVYSTDPFYLEGDTFEAEWKLSEKDGEYEATLANAKLNGAANSDGVYLSYYERLVDWCPYAFNRMAAELFPMSYGFTGEAYQSLVFCATYEPLTDEARIEDWIVEYTLETK